jgi:hypothetical protein
MIANAMRLHFPPVNGVSLSAATARWRQRMIGNESMAKLTRSAETMVNAET